MVAVTGWVLVPDAGSRYGHSVPVTANTPPVKQTQHSNVPAGLV